MTDPASALAPQRAFILKNTVLRASALVPGIKLHLATELTPLWLASEAFLSTHNLAPPFWAFAWPGAEALALHITRNPGLVRGRRVLDFAAGCGLAAIACAKAGAGAVTAADIDPLAAAIALNAARNRVQLEVLAGDLTGAPCRWDIILAGDVCYEAPMTAHILPWLRDCARTASVILADPGRKYAPAQHRQMLARITVPTSLALEDSTSREVALFKLLPASLQR